MGLAGLILVSWGALGRSEDALGLTSGGDVATRGAAESATVANLLLDVGDNGTLRHLTNGEDVADGESSVLTGVDELAGVHALDSQEVFLACLEPVRVPEVHNSQGCTTTRVVDNFLQH